MIFVNNQLTILILRQQPVVVQVRLFSKVASSGKSRRILPCSYALLFAGMVHTCTVIHIASRSYIQIYVVCAHRRFLGCGHAKSITPSCGIHLTNFGRTANLVTHFWVRILILSDQIRLDGMS